MLKREDKVKRMLVHAMIVYLLLLPILCYILLIACFAELSSLSQQLEEAVNSKQTVSSTYTAPAVSTCTSTDTVQSVVPCTKEEEELLVSLVIAEAKGEPYEGQVAVAQVVCDRVAYGFGASITEVIYAKNQFATPSTEPHENYPLAVAAVQAVLYEGARAFEEPTIFFFNPKWSSPSATKWLRTKPYVGTIGNHEFRGI